MIKLSSLIFCLFGGWCLVDGGGWWSTTKPERFLSHNNILLIQDLTTGCTPPELLLVTTAVLEKPFSKKLLTDDGCIISPFPELIRTNRLMIVDLYLVNSDGSEIQAGSLNGCSIKVATWSQHNSNGIRTHRHRQHGRCQSPCQRTNGSGIQWKLPFRQAPERSGNGPQSLFSKEFPKPPDQLSRKNPGKSDNLSWERGQSGLKSPARAGFDLLGE